VGVSALATQTSGGSFNTAIGRGSMASTTGSHNTAVGRNSLMASSSASGNTAIGNEALTANNQGTDNTAVGKNSMVSNTSGISNVAVGCNSLDTSTQASYNVAVGQNAGQSNSSGTQNVYVGWAAGNNVSSGSQNVFVGSATAYINNCTGSHHTGIGREALHNLTDGDANTALGRSALKICTSGDNNIGIGAYAGDGTVTTAGGNILIGYNTELEGVGQENEIVIGTSSSGKGSSTGFFNPNGGNAFQGNNSSAWATTSDERIKKNIKDNTDGLDIINQIRVRNFEYRTEDEIVDFNNPKSAVVEKEGIKLGAIAQEIEKVLPEVVTTLESGVKTVDPNNLTWYLINAVQELSAEVEKLKNG
jgi:hypothetical protein